MKLSEAQKIAREVHEKIENTKAPEKRWGIFHLVTDLCEETGEVASAVKGLEGFKTRKYTKQDLEEELADVLYDLCLIANHYDINLEDIFEDKAKKSVERYAKGVKQ